jgi:HK97 family phage major capsid protein
MADEIKDVINSLNKSFDEFKSANDARIVEIETKGVADPLTVDKIAKIEAKMDAMQKVADEAVLASKRSNRVVTDENGNAVDIDAILEQKARQFERAATSFTNRPMHGTVKGEELEAFKAAQEAYLRKGEGSLTDIERKTLSVGGDPTGGYVVHPDMSGQIVKQVFETSPMRAYASVQVISTDALEGLFDLNEAGSGWVAETAARPSTTTPDLGAWRIPVHEMFGKPLATQKLLDDAEINIEQWLAAKIADSFMRLENAAFVTGDGVGKPRGFLTYAGGTTLPGTIDQTNSGANGALASAPAGGDALIGALYDLKAQYRANANWFMNRGTSKIVRQTKDSDGAYLWAPGIAAGQPATLLGYPVASFEDMPDPATGSLSIAVGDMRAAYQIVDRMGIRTLRDPYSAKPYVEFYSTKRVGGDVVNFEAIKILKLAA